MTGGLLQLVSVGFEDLYLTSDPEITFFKMVYKRYTNFSQEPIKQLFSTTPDFGKRLTCILSKTADLLSNVYLYLELPNIPKFYNNDNTENIINKISWSKKIGYSIIDYVELEINGQIIDKQYGDWMNIWSQLSVTNDRITEDILIGNTPDMYNLSNGKQSKKLYIPLNFFFNKNKGLSLPLIALHLSDVKIHVEFRKIDDIIIKNPSHYIEIDENIVHFSKGDILTQNVSGFEINIIFNYFDYNTKRLYYTKYDNSIISYNSESLYDKDNYKICNKEGYFVYPLDETIEQINIITLPSLSISKSYIIANFIYLDILERKKFAEAKHEYLIKNLQYSGEKTIYNSRSKIKLGFINPCVELFWVGQFSKIKNGFLNQKFNYTDSINNGTNIIKRSKIIHNGQERTADKDKFYYNYIEPYIYHSNSPVEGINIFSFSLQPENYQPHGSCNYSKIDDIVLEMTLSNNISYNNPALVRIYSYNYNILRIINGLAGLAFSN